MLWRASLTNPEQPCAEANVIAALLLAGWSLESWAHQVFGAASLLFFFRSFAGKGATCVESSKSICLSRIYGPRLLRLLFGTPASMEAKGRVLQLSVRLDSVRAFAILCQIKPGPCLTGQIMIKLICSSLATHLLRHAVACVHLLRSLP